MRAILPAVLALTLAAPAFADEVWSTARGDAIYAAEMNGVAILTVPMGEGTARVYLPGLGGNYDNRSSHEGYWIGDRAGSCPTALIGEDEVQSRQWGRVFVAFDGPAFPTSWTMMFGDCFGPLDRSVRGEARVGG